MAERLRHRRDFLKARSGQVSRTPAFVLQARMRSDPEQPAPPRIGYTVTKRVGNAVERNRIKRRLREAVRLADKEALLQPCVDYVLIARRDALTLDFESLRQHLDRACRNVHKALREKRATAPKTN